MYIFKSSQEKTAFLYMSLKKLCGIRQIDMWLVLLDVVQKKRFIYIYF